MSLHRASRLSPITARAKALMERTSSRFRAHPFLRVWSCRPPRRWPTEAPWRITRSTQDFRGRTRNENRQWNNPTTGADGNLNYTVLYDPDTRTRAYLYPAARFARQYVYAAPPPAASPAPPANNPLAPTVPKEDLGVKFSCPGCARQKPTRRGALATKSRSPSPMSIGIPPACRSTSQ